MIKKQTAGGGAERGREEGRPRCQAIGSHSRPPEVICISVSIPLLSSGTGAPPTAFPSNLSLITWGPQQASPGLSCPELSLAPGQPPGQPLGQSQSSVDAGSGRKPICEGHCSGTHTPVPLSPVRPAPVRTDTQTGQSHCIPKSCPQGHGGSLGWGVAAPLVPPSQRECCFLPRKWWPQKGKAHH